jgi:site-specific DNA-cytosine methylase
VKVLIACEFTGIVRDAFIEAGHKAVSCDLLPTLSPGPHYQGDVRDILSKGWDLMIAHPPCTDLAVSGARWWPEKIADGRQAAALDFVRLLGRAPISRIAIENPVGKISTTLRKPDQIVQPWMFGDQFTKTTCLWLKNLPPLKPTKIVGKGEFVIHGGRKLPKWYSNRERHRSATFPGIAAAMAAQWGRL